MLIRVSPGSARDHRKVRRAEDVGQYRVQRGIARVALEAKAEGKELRDSGGRPFLYANGAARFGYRELEARLGGRPNRVVVGEPQAQSRRVPWPWEK